VVRGRGEDRAGDYEERKSRMLEGWITKYLVNYSVARTKGQKKGEGRPRLGTLGGLVFSEKEKLREPLNLGVRDKEGSTRTTKVKHGRGSITYDVEGRKE